MAAQEPPASTPQVQHGPAPGSPPPADRRQIRRRKKANHPSPEPAGGSPADTDPPTAILLPPDIPLPITIQHLFVPPQRPPGAYAHQRQAHAAISKTTPLFSYYAGDTARRDSSPSSSAPGPAPEAAPAGLHRPPAAVAPESAAADLKTYESPVTGELVEWAIAEGQVLHARDGWRTRPIVRVKEPCTHAVQWHGQCALCGSDLTIGDYTGISETSRASIPMSHGPSTLTVSVSEAQRLESETRTRLLKAQKLSLIVDLDQTIVHATVDPTVGEWMADPSNPNWPALQGVSRFQLNDPPSLSNEGCYYYLKQRPGLADFLHSLADKYEMHVYTMGTRAYADAVCKIIDPTGEIFSDRILSRDESGSMTQKSITRLFPVDTSMVVIIDDRGDVWEYSPNLVSVLPYNFFVGIGDINGAFLPPARPLEPPPPTQPEAAAPASAPKDPIAVLPVMTVTDDAGATSALAKGEQPGGASEGAAGGAGPTRETIAAVHAGETSAAPPPSTVQAPDTASAPLPAETTTSEELAKSARSKLIADQVLSRPLKQKQIALTQHEQAKRKAGAAHRRRSQPSSVATRGSQTGAESTTSSRAVTPVPPILPSSSPSSSSSSSAASSSAVCPPEDAAPPHLTSSPDPGPPSSLPLKPAALDSDSADDSDTNTDLSLDEFDDNQLLRGPERPVLVDHDTELSRLQTILGDIHSGFYSQDSIEEADARMVISAIKHDVLHGTHLAFSSLWPMEAVSQQQYAWKLAEQFGACCYTHLSPKVTHLVAAKLGTSKVNQALSRPNVAIVGPKWLYDAALLWTRPAEARYTWRVGPHAASSEPSEPGAGGGGGGGEGEGEEEGEGGIQEEWGMGAADWQEATAEVMAALDESDDDEDSLDDRSSASSDLHRPPRKRSRTPSNRDPSRPPSRPSDDPLLRTHGQPDAPAADSPLSKRKRIARSRSSKLKLVVPLIDNPSDPPEQSVLNPASAGSCDQPRQANSPDGLLVKPLDLSSVDQLSPEDDEFLSALAAEMEGNMNS